MAHPAGLPTLALSSRSRTWLPTTALIGAAGETGTAGLDLDLDRRWPAPNRGRAAVEAQAMGAGTPVISLWLPRWDERQTAAAAFDRELDRCVDLASTLRVRRVVVDRTAAMRPGGRQDKRALLMQLQSRLGPGVRVTLAVRSEELVGTREHLGTLGSLRRMGEEWDFDVALDLSGNPDPRWEAEAALQRLKTRLRLVRLTLPGTGSVPTAPGRLANRTVAWLLDQSFDGTISLVAAPRLTRCLSRSALIDATADQVRAIGDRHRRIFSPSPSLRILPSRQTM